MRHAIRWLPLGLVAALVLCAGMTPARARAADADSTQIVSCKLPGEIRSMGGHPRMAAGQIVQTTPADCRQRGGEYTVPEAPQAAASKAASAAGATTTTAEDRRIVYCLLPAQTRQLGEKASYRTRRHSIRTSREECGKRGGTVYVPRKKAPAKKPD